MDCQKNPEIDRANDVDFLTSERQPIQKTLAYPLRYASAFCIM